MNAKLFTFIIATGYSGNARATALAPTIFVRFEIPTKNSLPKKKQEIHKINGINNVEI